MLDFASYGEIATIQVCFLIFIFLTKDVRLLDTLEMVPHKEHVRLAKSVSRMEVVVSF